MRRESFGDMTGPLLQQPWAQSTLLGKLAQQTADGLQTPRLLLTDIDGTFIDKATEYEDSTKTQSLIVHLRKRHYGLVAITGRDMSMMLRDYKKGILPLFDVVITAVGTERYVLQEDGKYILDQSYSDHIERTLQFDRQEIYKHCLAFQQRVMARAQAGDDTFQDLELTFQPRDQQPRPTPDTPQPQPYKISFNYYGDEATSRTLHTMFRTILDEAGHPAIKLVFSIDSKEGGRIRNNIDVLPIEKDGAANLLLHDLKHIYGEVFGLYAGDSMNDYHAICLVGHAAIVVGGSDPTLLKQLRALRFTTGFHLHPRGDGFRYLYIEKSHDRKGPMSLLFGLRSFEAIAKILTADLVKDGPRLPGR